VTIGLETITFNPDCTAIVFASGEDKAESVAGAVELAPSLDHPGTALQKLQHARVYVTRGAAARLTERRFRSLTASGPISDREIDRLVIDGARISGIPLAEVKAAKKNAATPQQAHLRAAENIAHRKLSLLIDQTCDNLSQAIQKGMNIPEQQRFLHTGPHHDDIELAYFPLLHHLVRSPKNHNYFCYLTSGFTSVTNDFVMQSMMILAQAIKSSTLYSVIHRDDVYDPRKRAIEINEYLNAIAQQNMSASGLYRAIRLFRRIAQHIRSDSDYSVLSFAEEQIALLRGHIPGSKVPDTVKQIKSWIREWEAELVWAHFGLDNSNIFHLGLRFYSDDLFPDDLDQKKDVAPIVRLLQKVNPTIVTLAMDPEGSGPDTHYKTLLAMRAALQAYMKKRGGSRPRIWGYRNVWSQFHPAQVNMIVPVSLNSFAVLHNMFNTCFLSQKTASFPSSKFDGTFSELAQKIWVQQFNDITALLGKRFFYDDKHPMMRRAYGAIYLKDMGYEEFLAETERMK
jgi:glucosamine-6-phosphate deaminase